MAKNIESESALNPEKSAELKSMKDRIEGALASPEVREQVAGDFAYTFRQLGLNQTEAGALCEEIFLRLGEPKSLDLIEQEILSRFSQITVGEESPGKNLIEVLHTKLADRAKIIFEQVKDYLEGLKGKVLDFGAGDGQVTQLLKDELGLDIYGADVRNYKEKHATVPFMQFDGHRLPVVDGTFEAGLMTNVAHHEKFNQRILDELSRTVTDKLVIIETVPVGASEEEIATDRERTFMNDYLYNRLFHNADVPVPGTYETPEGWKSRFSSLGWALEEEKNLGIDQPTIKDTHHLLVFKRVKK